MAFGNMKTRYIVIKVILFFYERLSGTNCQLSNINLYLRCHFNYLNNVRFIGNNTGGGGGGQHNIVHNN